jgi:uncharacterized integral membrane protein
MRGLKIIPLFIGLILFSYLGVTFVEANRTEVAISFGNFQWPPTAVGFVVLTSALAGMVLAGALCSIEILALFLRINRLRRRLALFEEGKLRPASAPKVTADLPDSAKAELSSREIG